MPATLFTYSDHADVGDTWRGWLLVTDHDGVASSADSVTLSAVLKPDGTPTAGTATEQDTAGLYLLEGTIGAAGTYLCTVTVTDADFGNDVITFSVISRSATGALPPDLSAVTAYLGEDCSYTSEEISDALDAETAAQAARCIIPVDYPHDLGQALKRRVARNLAARSVPVAQFTSYEGGATATRVTRYDAEVTRLEAPYLRWPVA
jgi:hypothetical protein